jgi:apolipoprotein N-acyltransferase
MPKLSRSIIQSKVFQLKLLPAAIALGSGLLMAFATAPLNWWGLAWVALAPLWVFVSKAEGTNKQSGQPGRLMDFSAPPVSPASFAALALLWSLAYYGITLSWILGLHPLTWLGVPWLASVAIASFCWVFITLWGTVPVLLWAWGMQNWQRRAPEHPTIRHSLLTVLFGTGLWCGLEWLRNLTPLDWASLSFTQSPSNLAILHLGQLSGPFLISASIVAVNGLIAEAWKMATPHTFRSLPPAFFRLILLAIALCSSLHLIGLSQFIQPLVDSETSGIKVGVIQGNVPTRIKLSGDGIRRAIDSYLAGYKQLSTQKVDAVLTPEGALPFYWDVDRNVLRQAVIAQQVPLWLGTFVKTDRTITQSLLSLSATGDLVGRYNKTKLVPLGEYIPFPEVLGKLINRLSPIEATMQPGTPNQQFDTPFGRAIAGICFDSAFPYLFRDQAAQGGEFIITAANLDPYSEVLMAQHQAHDLMRAIESDRWAIRATNTGYSSAIDPHGRIIWRSQPNTYQIHTVTVYRRQTQTLYTRWGDWATPTLVGSAALTWMINRRRI